MGNHNGWRFIGKRVRGAYHAKAKLPNQDAIYWWQKSIPGRSGFISISDGHGSPKFFRSHIGANFAVIAAGKACERLFLDPHPEGFSSGNRWKEKGLSQEIVHHWRQLVIDDLSEKPFTRQEVKAVEEKEGIRARRTVVANPILAYGATLLILTITERHILYMQLGDGDILVVSDDGEVTRPLGKNEGLVANETSSLCLPEAWRSFKINIQAVGIQPPALVLLSTDGYSDSFAADREFLQVGPDILRIIRSEGLDEVNDHLDSWLEETSRLGSGDDITLGIACRMDIAQKREELSLITRPQESPNLIQSSDSDDSIESQESLSFTPRRNANGYDESAQCRNCPGQVQPKPATLWDSF